ncbi:ABC transporter permease subunit [Actinomadura sp. LD22]|uniref:ABC transporter permease subunit n=1 Tax=Actinomadura physcomitrii TaxID=2650748 RepID=A0A6I4MJ51_9ACTN|nr:ABC transporter permease subunit [Actinomadura physcomitrii]MWA04930.1 ABC transporter permease subunit [Actinomadura physcomitrii]
MRAKAGHLLTVLLLPVTLPVLWWVASSRSSTPYYPPLQEILRGFRAVWTREQLAGELVPSLVSLVVGFAVAVAVGVGGGVALGLSDRLRRDVRPLTEFLRAMPVVALIPIALVLLGPGMRMEIALIAFAACWPVLVSTADGVRAADEVMLDTARIFGVPPRRRLMHVVLPGAMPQVMAGARIAVAAAVGTMVVANMVASSAGLGYLVISAQQSFNVIETWAGLLMIGIVGSCMTSAVVLIERFVLRWHRRWRAQDVDT